MNPFPNLMFDAAELDTILKFYDAHGLPDLNQMQDFLQANALKTPADHALWYLQFQQEATESPAMRDIMELIGDQPPTPEIAAHAIRAVREEYSQPVTWNAMTEAMLTAADMGVIDDDCDAGEMMECLKELEQNVLAELETITVQAVLDKWLHYKMFLFPPFDAPAAVLQ